VVNRTDYAFGLDRENTWHSDWQAADMESFKAWLGARAGNQVS
jgi:hypothetical protein